MTRAASPLPLEGIVVADFSRILAGPLTSQLLADAGARVIKVEEPGRGDETRRWGPPFAADQSAYFLALNRSKESITLNLKAPEGRRVARRLIERADVVIQNFLPAQQKLFGLTAAQVRRINRRAVHCTIRGYDRESEEADLPGYDLLAQAGAGLMQATGESGGSPMKVGVALADVLTAHYAAGAINAGLLQRERSGVATAVEISLFGAAAASLVNVAQNFLVTGREPSRHGNEHPSIVPYQAFRASDRMFVLAVATDRHFELLCRKVLGTGALLADSRFSTNSLRVTHRADLIPRLEEIIRTRRARTWVDRCRRAGIPASLVQTFEELFAGAAAPLLDVVDHPTVGSLTLVGSPVRLNGKRQRSSSAPPLLGSDTTPVLRELGYSVAEIHALRARGIL